MEWKNVIPSTGKNHWAYAFSGQWHCKASTHNRVKIEKTGVEINWAQGSRCNHNWLKPIKYRLYGKRSIMTTELERQIPKTDHQSNISRLSTVTQNPINNRSEKLCKWKTKQTITNELLTEILKDLLKYKVVYMF